MEDFMFCDSSGYHPQNDILAKSSPSNGSGGDKDTYWVKAQPCFFE
ncbi:MAG: hypothetical protein IJX49_04905 [Clostridia bacterium]|nr:hypothetical protein [Clostridia bacterium]